MPAEPRALARVHQLATRLVSNSPNRTVVLAIDGPDCSGKTTLATQLADGWHRSVPIVDTDPLITCPDEDILALPGPIEFVSLFDSSALASSIQTALSAAQVTGADLLLVEGLFLCRYPAVRLFDAVVRLPWARCRIIRLSRPRRWQAPHQRLPRYIDVIVHGNSTEVGTRSGPAVNAIEFSRVLDGISSLNGKPIRLMACSAGRLDDGFAQRCPHLVGQM